MQESFPEPAGHFREEASAVVTFMNLDLQSFSLTGEWTLPYFYKIFKAVKAGQSLAGY